MNDETRTYATPSSARVETTVSGADERFPWALALEVWSTCVAVGILLGLFVVTWRT